MPVMFIYSELTSELKMFWEIFAKSVSVLSWHHTLWDQAPYEFLSYLSFLNITPLKPRRVNQA